MVVVEVAVEMGTVAARGQMRCAKAWQLPIPEDCAAVVSPRRWGPPEQISPSPSREPGSRVKRAWKLKQDEPPESHRGD